MDVASTPHADRGHLLRLPDFLIVGAMRSGTTSLSQYLSEHPAVFIARSKELHFFDLNERFERGLEWYASNFASAPSGARLGEATQTYMYLPNALDRIATVLPGRRAIGILRDPADRAYSHYWHNIERGREHLGFEDAIRAEPDRLDGADVRTRLRYSYVDRGRYLRQLEDLERVFGAENVLVLLFEDLTRAPAAVFSRVCRFLSVDVAFVPSNIGAKVNPYVHVRSPRLRDWAKRLPKRFQDGIGHLNSRPSEYPPLDPERRAKLGAEYVEDLAGLQRRPELDLSKWPTVAAAGLDGSGR